MVLQLQGYIVHNEDNVASYKEWNRKKKRGRKNRGRKQGKKREKLAEKIFLISEKKNLSIIIK